MLLNLQVKNLALIEKADVEFQEGLNILTGETGAGKSIIIGSVNIALGGKVSKDMIRQGSEFAYVELVFSIDDPKKREALAELEVYPDQDGLLIISKKIMTQRSISKINDETVTATKLKQVTGLLLDIHGQHEHQSLLYPSKHLEILDEYAKSQIHPIKQNISQVFEAYSGLKKKLDSFRMDQEERARQADFYRFEIDEIENAALKEGEEEELTTAYRRFSNVQKITESLRMAASVMDTDQMGKALKAVNDVAEYDQELKPIVDQLYDIDSLISDVSHGIRAYMEELFFDQEEFSRVEERLDLIHNLQAKYGKTIEHILTSLEEKKKVLDELENFDELRRKTELELQNTEGDLKELCRQLSAARQQAARDLTEKIREGLLDLNFLDTLFDMKFETLPDYTANGLDKAEFLISTNPGEPLKPLGAVASGGELSRIMLAIKTVLANSDEIPTLIFDEIDTGISGRTAQMVSEKLRLIAKNHQILCITHLPQIAAMANAHFEIAKIAKDGKTTTNIRLLSEEESVSELARLLGGAMITEAVLQNAREMKNLNLRINKNEF